jgi:CRISPR type III-B/RAMP module RAMP protein Cmr1
VSDSQLEFTLELVTPAFVAGARAKEVHMKSGKQTLHRLIGVDGDGLRIPSLRGLLRFWFRAKEGAAPGLLSVREARIFGSTERGQGVRLIPRESPPWTPKMIEARAGSAKSYLGYGPLNYVKEDGKVSSHHGFGFRDAIPEGSRFSFLALGSREQIEELKKCLVLIHLFGAVGGRSRRGWGSLRVECTAMTLNPIDPIGPWINDVLVKHVWGSADARPSERDASPAYSAFWQDTRIRCLGSVHKSPDEVLEAFFEQFRLTRLYNRNNPKLSPEIAKADHDDEWATANGGGLSKAPQRMAFGFPYNVRFSKGNEVEYTASAPMGDKTVEIHRRASPLLLKVIKLGSNRFSGVALFFNNPFFSKPAATIGATVNGSVLPARVPPPPSTAVDAYLGQPDWVPVALP